MDINGLKSFAGGARREFLAEVAARLRAVIAPGSTYRVEAPQTVAALETDIETAGGGTKGQAVVTDRVAYTWFNRIVALRFMDANNYTGVGVVSPPPNQPNGQPEVLVNAKQGIFDPKVIPAPTAEAITGLLNGTRPSHDPQSEAYTLLLTQYCRFWNQNMPFMFEPEGDYTELLIPANLLATESILTQTTTVLTPEACQDVEVIGWLYQFYISERKDEVFAQFKNGKKAGAQEIPPATQLFTPHWIVRYVVENSLGRLWMLNNPTSQLVDQMDYYITPLDDETEFLKINSPEELTIIDPACGSGHMLTYAFDLLYAIYEAQGYPPSQIPSLILTHNLYGTEIDQRAGSLAAFALTMKARAKQHTFFNKNTTPNICVLEPITFTPQELDQLITSEADPDEQATYWNQFQHADEFGSLIQPSVELTETLKAHVSQLRNSNNVLTTDIMDRADGVVNQTKYLQPKYTTVITNPPYMRANTLKTHFSAWLKKHYSDFRSDLFSAFVWRCHELAVKGGRVGVMTPNVWMYLSSHEALRTAIVSTGKLESLVELPLSGFKGATVQICAYTFTTVQNRANTALFVQLTELAGSSDFARRTIEAIKRPDSELRYTQKPADFTMIPGAPVAYWLSSALRAAFRAGTQLTEIANTCVGLQTGNNEQFLRYWWEVSLDRLRFGVADREEATRSQSRWFPYNKGGAFRKWYGNQEHVVDWENDGRELHLRRPKSVIRNPSTYFKPSVSWSKVSSGEPAFREYPSGFIYDVAGTSIFTSNAESRLELLAFTNSSVSLGLLQAIAPTLNYEVGQISQLPVISLHDTGAVSNARAAIAISQQDWDSFETSWDFHAPIWPIHASQKISLDKQYEALTNSFAQIARSQQAREIENNKIVATAYGLLDEVSSDVPLHRVSLSRNVQFRYGPNKSQEEYTALERADLASELVSYGVGCMLGRYSLDEPGFILADQGATLDDYLAKVPSPSFTPDSDNVIPIVDGDWFEDDIVSRFHQFLRVAFGEEHFETNLRFIEESLGVKTLREYFITPRGKSHFYDDHWERYKKRPIYWMFSSPKGTFNALIYMHRYNPSTVSVVLNEYLHNYIAKLEASLQHQERLATGEGTARQQAAALKETELLRRALTELKEYEHDVLYPLATQQINIDLDDGVKTNYPKFHPALRLIPGL